MQTGGKNKQDYDVTSSASIIGVSLINDVQNTAPTCLGVCLLLDRQLSSWKLTELRKAIVKDVIACPPNFQICTQQGWPLSESQEEQLLIHQVLDESQQVLIRVQQERPKCGIKDEQGRVLGFVYINYSEMLATLRILVQSQILKSEGFPKNFNFLDGNFWPISTVQENHMTVASILIGCCVSTNLHSAINSVTFSPPKQPPLKKLKGLELSFRSGKDIFRQLDSQVSQSDAKPKQVLISYVRSEAADHALRLKQHLTELGLSVYLDVHEIHTGVDWQDSLNFAVSGCEVFIPLVTLKYGETQWTNREVKLADVLGKYILPVNFLSDWPPRCLAIQFATTQFIPSIPPNSNNTKVDSVTAVKPAWSVEHIKIVSQLIVDRIKGLSLQSVPSLMKRTTIVKSCACVREDNQLAIMSDRDGKPLIVICLHHTQQAYGEELESILENEGFEVWCTTQLDREHVDYIDGLSSSQDDITYSILNKGRHDEHSGCHSNSLVRNIDIFREKADDASLVLFILSDAFSNSRVCQQQVFYCEHRKHVIPVLYEEFTMPDWMSMLVGSHGFQMRKDEDFIEILLRRIKTTIGSSHNSQSPSSLVAMETTDTRLTPETMVNNNEGTSGSVSREVPNDEIDGVRMCPETHQDDWNGDTCTEAQTNGIGKETNTRHLNKGSDIGDVDANMEVTGDKPRLCSMKTVIL